MKSFWLGEMGLPWTGTKRTPENIRNNIIAKRS